MEMAESFKHYGHHKARTPSSCYFVDATKLANTRLFLVQSARVVQNFSRPNVDPGHPMTNHLDATLDQVLSVLARVSYAVNTALANSASVIAAQKAELETTKAARDKAETGLKAATTRLERDERNRNNARKSLYDWKVPEVHASQAANIRAAAAEKDLAALSALHRTTILNLRAAPPSPSHAYVPYEDHDAFLRDAHATLAGGGGPAVEAENEDNTSPVGYGRHGGSGSPTRPPQGGGLGRESESSMYAVKVVDPLADVPESPSETPDNPTEDDRPLTVARLGLVARERSRHVPALKLAALMAQYVVTHRFKALLEDVADDNEAENEEFTLRPKFSQPSRKEVRSQRSILFVSGTLLMQFSCSSSDGSASWRWRGRTNGRFGYNECGTWGGSWRVIAPSKSQRRRQ